MPSTNNRKDIFEKKTEIKNKTFRWLRNYTEILFVWITFSFHFIRIVSISAADLK